MHTIAQRMREVEHQGDDARRDLIEILMSALNTPIDREDLFRLSRSIDDVLDNLRDFMREVKLFLPFDTSICAPLIPPLREGLLALKGALSGLDSKDSLVADNTLIARKAVNSVRQSYQLALASVFSTQLSNETLKQKEVLRRLDVAGLRLSEAADALADGWLKRS